MYKDYYKLSQNPFQLNANLDFFFDSASHKRAKAYLRYGLVQGEGFVVVTGQPGTGKTMLVKDLFQFLSQDKNIIHGMMLTSQLNAEDTLRMLAQIFKVRYKEKDSKSELIIQLKEFLTRSANSGKRVLLVVDEAQNLPNPSIEELRMLSNFECHGKSILQIFLVGQEELGYMLNMPEMEQVKQRIVATYHLNAIKQDEIKNYIYFRLSKAGWNHKPEFEDDIFSGIYEFTLGIPRRINTLCDRLLLYGFLEELQCINLGSLNHVISEMVADYQGMKVNEDKQITPGFQSGEMTVNTDDQSHSHRIAHLEHQVSELTILMNKERALLRKAILIQLDMDQVYSDPE